MIDLARMDALDMVWYFLIVYPPILFGIVLHEAAHAWTARRLGDDGPSLAGRVSLNPMRHISIPLTILLPVGLQFLGLPPFGMAKPLLIDDAKLGWRGEALVAMAGPAANCVQILAWSAARILAESLPAGTPASVCAAMAAVGITANAIMALMNLIPIPPLDGSKLWLGAFSRGFLDRHRGTLEILGLALFLGMVNAGIPSRIIVPAVKSVLAAFS